MNRILFHNHKFPGRIIILLFLLIVSGCSNHSNVPLQQRLQMVLDKGVKKYHLRGVSAAIVFHADSIWAGTSGISHDTVAMKPDMLFSIGSVTKNFVATLTLKLVEEGTLSLEDKVSKWLPSYPHVDPNITIRQLLNHTSGLYMFWNNQELWKALIADRTKVWQPEEVLQYIKEPHFQPGEGWRYSNTNYLLMAMIIEKATHSTLASELKKHLWDPLNLKHYHVWLTDIVPENQAHVFGNGFQPGTPERDLTFQPRASHESITFGSSGIVTTATDLARWCYHLYEGNVLTDESMKEMLRFVKFRPISNMRGYGLGVQLFRRRVANWEYAIGHGGGNIGSATYMVYLPRHHTSIVVMVNAFPTRSLDYFTKGLVKELAKSSI